MNQITNESKSELSLLAVIEHLRAARTSPERTRFKTDLIGWQAGRLFLTVSIPRSTPLSEAEEFLREMQPLMLDAMNEADGSETVSRAQLVPLPSGMQASDVSFILLPQESKSTPIDDHFV